jgi:xylulokinase
MTSVSLGLDIGTGSSKACLLDRDGQVVSMGRSSYTVQQPHIGWSEIDPMIWLASIRDAIRQALAQAPDATIEAVGLTGQMHGVVLCSATGGPTRPAVLWPDRRAGRFLTDMADRLAPHAESLGNPLYPGMAGPILHALAAEEEEALREARWALQPKDWVRLMLTGHAQTDPSDASGTLLWDLDRDRWSTPAAHALGIDPNSLPPVLASDALAGETRPGTAAQVGLPTGLPVAVGGADTAASLFGAGVAVGESQVTTGTGGQIAVLLDAPRPDPKGQTNCYRAIGPDRWYALAAIQNVGVAVDWGLRALGADHLEAEAAAARTQPGCGGITFVPYLTGERAPRMDAGLTGKWVGLHPGVSRDQLIRSVFEGVACSMRDGLDALRTAGHDIDVALLAGGGSKAGWWRQLLADALDIPLIPHAISDASARGAAILGFAAIGEHIDPSTHVQRGEPVEPEPHAIAASLDRYRAAVTSD